jgi:hypothetical protein
MPVSTEERLDILQDVSKSWLELVKTIRKLSDDQIVKPETAGEWSVKDVMAHITFWEGRLIHYVGILEQGGTPPDSSDFETVNREEATRSRSASLDEVKAQFDEMHDQLMKLLEVTPVISRDLIAGNTYDHYNEHLADIRAAFGR